MSKRANEVKTKSENKQAIYRFLLENGPATKQDIYIGLGLSLPTIKQGLEFLEQERLIAAAGKIENTGGRNATAYQISGDSYCAIGVYISQHHLTAVCVNLTGDVTQSQRLYCPLEPQNEAYLKAIGSLVEEVRAAMPQPSAGLLGVGIAIPSLVSEDGEGVLFGMTSDFTGITREVLSRYIPFPTRMYHDSHVAGYAEVWKNPSLKNAVYLNLNNSIGSSLILDGKLYTGDNHRTGELGHIIVDPRRGKKCYCGRIGCLDTLCNASVLDAYTGGNLEQFFRLLEEGDGGAAELWEEYLDHLALAIHNLRMMFDCTFIIGGYVGTYIEKYMPDLWRRIDAYSIFTPHSQSYVLPCRYKYEATAAGAAIQMTEAFIRSL